MKVAMSGMKCLFGIILILGLGGATAWAQTTGEISGTVTDTSGALLPGVEVSVTQTDTGATRNAVSNEVGGYVFTNLPLGPYELEGALPGFQTYVQTGILLQVGSAPRINVVMEVGQVTQTIEVQANRVMVETRTLGVASIMENERILELPLNGRQVESLITLAGGAVSDGGRSNRALGGEEISVAGSSVYAVDYTLDGANHMNYTSSAGHAMPFPDALEEFNVRTSGLSAENARAVTVGAVTKSGTNQFHGSAFEFVRNDALNAREYFSPTNSTLKRNQFGGTFGGPIIGDKLFFFAAVQFTTLRSDPANEVDILPTEEMKLGDFRNFGSEDCEDRNLRDITNWGGPDIDFDFNGNNTVDPALFSPAAMSIINTLPRPQDQKCGEFTYGILEVDNASQYVGRVDYTVSDRHSVFGRYNTFGNRAPSPFLADQSNILLADVRTLDNLGQYLALGDTYLFGDSTVNSFRFTYNRVKVGRDGTTFYSPCDHGVNMYCGYVPKTSNISVRGGFELSQTSAPLDFLFSHAFDVNNDLSFIMGDHQITVGGGINRTLHQAKTSSRAVGDFDFRTGGSREAVANFMVGFVDRFIQGALSTHNPMRWFPRVYATDTWRVTPTLTLNYGLRWDPQMPEHRLNDSGFSWTRERFDAGFQSSVFNNSAPGFFYFGDSGFPDNSGGIEPIWNQFAPRIGLAWDMFGDGSTSLRTSYSYNYEVVPMEWANEMGNAPPFGNRVEVNQVLFDDPWRGTFNPHPFDLDANVPFGSGGNYPILPTDFSQPDTSSWNLSIQRQLPGNTLVSATYVGNITNHFMGVRQINPAVFFPGETDANGNCSAQGFTIKADSRGRSGRTCSVFGNTQQRRVLNLLRPGTDTGLQGSLLQLGAMTDRSPEGTQRYAGLITSVQTRPSERLNFNANYTWGHCIGDYTSGSPTAGPNTDQTQLKPLDRRFDWGDCNLDRRHIFNLTSVLGTPDFANNTTRMLLGNWRLAVIYRASSGEKSSIFTSDDDLSLTGTATGHQRGNQILPSVYLNKSPGPNERYLDPDAVADPAEGAFGNLGRNSVVGPRQWDFDVALSRVFNVGETSRIEFRAEAYNLTNSFRATPGDVDFFTIDDRNFGRFNAANGSARSPRILQGALKFVF